MDLFPLSEGEREFVVIVDGNQVKRITNVNEELRKILGLLGSEYEKYYV